MDYLGFWAGYLAKHGIDAMGVKTKAQRQVIRYIRIFANITSVLLIIAFPIETFIGITLLRESWMLQDDQLPVSEEITADKEKLNTKNNR